jgi:hypothetical protein
MNQNNVAAIRGNEVTPTVQDLWTAVFECGEIVIGHWKSFGFGEMHKPNPNIHDLILYVSLLDGAITALLNEADKSFEEVRLLLNTRRRLATMKEAGKYLEQGKQEEFEAAMVDLANQAPF